MSPSLPSLVVTNPIWLWMYLNGVEDQDWGTRPVEQHTIALAIHELSGKISDDETRKLVQGAAAKLLVKTTQALVERSPSK